MSLRSLVFVAATAALAASADPVQLLPANAADQFVDNCRQKNLFFPLAATDKAPAGIRMQSAKQANPIWNGGESSVATVADVAEGDLLVLTIAARGVSDKGKGDILAKFQDSGYNGIIRENVTTEKDWAWHRYTTVAKQDYPAGSLRLHLYPGAVRQVVEFRAITLENYGKVKIALPPLSEAPAFGSDPIPDAPEPPKPVTLAPLSAEEKAIPRYVMLKLDDFNASKPAKGVHPWYRRVADFLKGKNLKAGFGVVVNSLEGADNAEWIKWVQENSEDNGGSFEFWNHGWNHAMNFDFEGQKIASEFQTPSLAYQRENLNKSQSLFQEKTGLTFHSFGSAGNGFNEHTSVVLAEHPEIEVWMYGNGKSPAGKLVLGRPLNLEYAVGKVGLQEFLKAYQHHRTDLRNGVVLQGHPNMWNDDVFAEFKKVVEVLVEDGWTFTTPHEYYTKYKK